MFIPLRQYSKISRIFPAPRYQTESIQNFTISKIFEERIYDKFEGYRIINSNLINSKFKASQFLIKHNKSDLIISLAGIFYYSNKWSNTAIDNIKLTNPPNNFWKYFKIS